MSLFKLAQRLFGGDKPFENSGSSSNSLGSSGWASLQTVDGLIVEDFQYLLRYVSDGRLHSFDDLDALKSYKFELIQAIDEELAKEVMPEESRGASRETAEANLHNLRRIIISLTRD